MTTRTALFTLLTVWGVGVSPALPAIAQDAPTEDTEPAAEKHGLTDRVWTQSNGDLPGVMRIFLSDGTLVMDSCWETHRLAPWTRTSDTSVSWDEDGMQIKADIVSLTDTDLVLKLNLVSGAVEERYTAAAVPFLCPDMPK